MGSSADSLIYKEWSRFASPVKNNVRFCTGCLPFCQRAHTSPVDGTRCPAEKMWNDCEAIVGITPC